MVAERHLKNCVQSVGNDSERTEKDIYVTVYIVLKMTFKDCKKTLKELCSEWLKNSYTEQLST
jgi:hypothetical protein